MVCFGSSIVPKSILKSGVLCINMCNVLKYFKTMVSDDFMNVRLECGIFLLKPLFYLYFHFMDFILVLVNPSIFILTYPKNQYFFGRTCPRT